MELFPLILAVARALETSYVGAFVRMTPNLYPILESLHVVGIALLVGSALTVDLRLIGAARNTVPVRTVTKHLLPLARLGFALVLLTGAAMFCGIAVSVVNSPAALWKFSLIGLAGVNIIVFHAGAYRTVATWEMDARPPAAARIAGLVSALSWISLIFAGRFLAY